MYGTPQIFPIIHRLGFHTCMDAENWSHFANVEDFIRITKAYGIPGSGGNLQQSDAGRQVCEGNSSFEEPPCRRVVKWYAKSAPTIFPRSQDGQMGHYLFSHLMPFGMGNEHGPHGSHAQLDFSPKAWREKTVMKWTVWWTMVNDSFDKSTFTSRLPEALVCQNPFQKKSKTQHIWRVHVWDEVKLAEQFVFLQSPLVNVPRFWCVNILIVW